LTAFDYGLLFVLACSMIIGVSRGLIREVVSLVGWVAAFVVANIYGEALARLLPDMLPIAIPVASIRVMTAYVVLFIGTRVATMLLARALDSLLGAGGLSGINRLLGSLFGLARGALIWLVFVLLCGLTALPQQAFWEKARFRSVSEKAALQVLPFLPAALAARIRYTFH
jgi:membrane protein required for colicin V production